MVKKRSVLWLFMLLSLSCIFGAQHKMLYQSQLTDTDRLNMAIEYFQSEKYHEALLHFQYLDKHYELNARYRAYMAYCYYHGWQYQEAVVVFDSIQNQLSVFAPQEQTVYYHAAAESHFYLSAYKKAIGYYEKTLNVCNQPEKANALYKIAICYLQLKRWENAHDFLQSALAYYQQQPSNADNYQRKKQINNMLNSTLQHISPQTDTIITADSSFVVAQKAK